MNSIDSVFNTENRKVIECFQQPGVGYYIPLYQREYAWDLSNIEQLIDDITDGIDEIAFNSDNYYRFLGTIITVTESNKNNIQPQDSKALPSSIEKVIDGQQRLSTITIFSVALFSIINKIEEKIRKEAVKYEWNDLEQDEFLYEIKSATIYWKNRLQKVFGVDLEEGEPTIKPKIIRGSTDKWILKELSINNSYNSPVSNFLYLFIENFFNEKEIPKLDKNSNVGKNYYKIYNWLDKDVCTAQIDEVKFLSSIKILDKIKQEYLWKNERVSIVSLINEDNIKIKDTLPYYISSLIQVFSVCHFLLDRCCFTIIKPANDEWAFDMFQSLNATGTPLTAIETFKPVVVQYHEGKYGNTFKDSDFNTYFSKIEGTFDNLNSAAAKNKLTNDLLTSIAIPIEGKKLPTHFSAQRKWLNEIFNELEDSRKLEFIKLFGNYSNFYKNVWLDYKGDSNLVLDTIKGDSESELASLLLLFLSETKHNMSITFLGIFYNYVIEGKENSIKTFIELVKCISAFYILWRSSTGNSGLDEVYREFFRGKKDNSIQSHKWLNKEDFTVSEIKEYLKSNLPYTDKPQWIAKAIKNCRYDNVYNLCNLILRIVSTDTIPDTEKPGLLSKSKAGVCNYLTLERWKTNDLNTIEHIAPKVNKGEWDTALYDDEQKFNYLGNLTLLPKNFNCSVNNKGWKEKYLYYSFVNLKDEAKGTELLNQAKDIGIELSENNISILKNCKYSNHLESLISNKDLKWDADLVISRSENILDIVYDRVIDWL